MARIRTVKPEFFASEQLAECSVTARLLFVGLWVFSDDNGVHPVSLMRLKMEVFPGDPFTVDDMRGFMAELVTNKLVIEFNASGKTFWAVPTWHNHQKIDKPTYRYPLPPFVERSPNQVRGELGEDSATTPQPLPPGMEWNGMESNGVEGKGEERSRTESNGSASKSKQSPSPPTSPSKRAAPTPSNGSPAIKGEGVGEKKDSPKAEIRWPDVAAALGELGVSRRQQAIENAIQNGFTQPQVLALIDYLKSVPDKCKSPAGAIFERLSSDSARDFDADQNWPWSVARVASGDGVDSGPSPYDVPESVQQLHAKRANDELLEKKRKYVQDMERRELAFGDQLNAMDEPAVLALISGDRILLRAFQAKGRDSPDVRPMLLKLLEKQAETDGGT